MLLGAGVLSCYVLCCSTYSWRSCLTLFLKSRNKEQQVKKISKTVKRSKESKFYVLGTFMPVKRLALGFAFKKFVGWCFFVF